MALTLVGEHFLPLYVVPADKPGRMFCACGWHSPVCPDLEERRRWFTMHVEKPEYVWDEDRWRFIDDLWCHAGGVEGIGYWLDAAATAYREAIAEVPL
jgi:hypothetical protein